MASDRRPVRRRWVVTGEKAAARLGRRALQESKQDLYNGPLRWRAVCFLEEIWEGCNDTETISVGAGTRFDGRSLRTVDGGGSGDDFV